MTDRIIGAKEKLANAQRMKMGESLGISAAANTAPVPSALKPVPLLFILLLATTLALLLSVDDGPFVNGHLTIFGVAFLDELLFGPGIPTLLDGGNIDLVLTLIARGVLIMIISGVIPFLTWLINKVADRLYGNVYVTNWCTITAVLLVTFLFKNDVAPIFKGFATLMQN